MSWVAYKLTFQMKSPLHSGYAKVGNIQQTRLFVTGRMLWGALTSRIARLTNNTNYIQIGKEIDRYLRTSYFFPCLDREGNRPILPEVKDYQPGYRVDCAHLKASQVECWLITSYASTAINKNTFTAEERSLHEVEFISDHFLYNVNGYGINIAAGDPVYLTGIFFLNKNAPSYIKTYLKQAVKDFQIGGERGYGFGRLSLIDEPYPTEKLFGRELILSSDDPEVSIDKNKPILAHAIASNELEMQGIIEPFLGRETSEYGEFGKKLSEVKPCWIPGSINNKKNSFLVKEKGIWEAQI